MSLIDFLKKQFIDVIDWVESDPGVLVWRYPMEDREIQSGAQLTVRESQLAVFINEGTVADTFKPGLYTLTTRTLPVLTNLKNWDKLFQSPFKSDVYYFSQREQLEQKWGTAQPITIRDKDYGPLRIRGFGTYSYSIVDPEPFWRRLAGTADIFTVDQLEGQLRAVVMTEIAAFLGGAEIAFVDMAANQRDFSERLHQALKQPFLQYGLELRSFYVQSLSLPEELQEHLDKAASMRLVGDLGAYTRFQTAESIPEAAANPGGIAGIGAGIGAGAAMAQAMGGQLGGALGSAGAAPAGGGNGGEDPLAVIERLHGLLGKGVITQAEFDAKKADLLNKI
jgi:membrane protease subunit (stomatin/prohibitin family)